MPRNPYLIEMAPEAILTILFGMKNGLNLGVPFPNLYSPNCSSKVEIPPSPQPHITPIRFLFKVSKSIFAFVIASSAAYRAYCVKRSYFLISFFSKMCHGLKFLTSHANLVLNCEVSNLVIGVAPLTPLIKECQYSDTLFPMGVTAPNPVITTLFIIF